MKNYWNLVKENKKSLIVGIVIGLVISTAATWW